MKVLLFGVLILCIHIHSIINEVPILLNIKSNWIWKSKLQVFVMDRAKTLILLFSSVRSSLIHLMKPSLLPFKLSKTLLMILENNYISCSLKIHNIQTFLNKYHLISNIPACQKLEFLYNPELFTLDLNLQLQTQKYPQICST